MSNNDTAAYDDLMEICLSLFDGAGGGDASAPPGASGVAAKGSPAVWSWKATTPRPGQRVPVSLCA